ncbi:sigma-54-dependent Fis family transcriptional regulator [Pseudonocardia sp.]|uniref:sigma-54-dependent Fis family transcriptional regulator n=1 Tax=Pseudonocardia sp. TaxID=60912 RepID=UPI003D0B43B8
MRVPNRRRHVAAAREQFLSSGSVARTAVGDTILTSWQRSRIAGVDIDQPVVPYDEAIDLHSRLARCAEPVMSRLQEQLDDIPVSVVLTDAQGRLIDRKDSERRLARIFDTVYFAPGFSYAEADVGTNGVGTALEDGRAVFVCGPEHFNERSMPFACAGAPIRNPLSRRIEGLIDLSCLAEDANPMMRALVHQAALDIERLLLEDGSRQQRLVLEEFLAACGRSGGAVLSVSGEVVMANRRASALLTSADEEMLRLAAADARQLAPGTVIEMSLGGRWAHVRCHPVTQGRELAGAVFEVHLADGRQPRRSGRTCPPTGLPGVAGRSAQWQDACTQVRLAARGRSRLLIVGEPGVGKLALVRAAHHEHTPAAGLTVLDCADAALPRVDDLVPGDRTTSATVVLRHLDRLAPDAVERAADLLDALAHAPAAPWVVATVGSATDDRLLRRFATSVTVPPLRHRLDDLPALVALLLKRLAPGRDVDCAAEAMRVLERNAWPGNVTELEHGLRAALSRRPAGQLRSEDLPPTCFTTSRRVLTPIEALQRDAIIQALNDAEGNRKKAAQELGMSRSSLYRKIHAFGITGLHA